MFPAGLVAHWEDSEVGEVACGLRIGSGSSIEFMWTLRDGILREVSCDFSEGDTDFWGGGFGIVD